MTEKLANTVMQDLTYNIRAYYQYILPREMEKARLFFACETDVIKSHHLIGQVFEDTQAIIEEVQNDLRKFPMKSGTTPLIFKKENEYDIAQFGKMEWDEAKAKGHLENLTKDLKTKKEEYKKLKKTAEDTLKKDFKLQTAKYHENLRDLNSRLSALKA